MDEYVVKLSDVTFGLLDRIFNAVVRRIYYFHKINILFGWIRRGRHEPWKRTSF